MSASDALPERVLDVLQDADKPLSAGQIQRRLAGNGFDATTGAIRDACHHLVDDGTVSKEGTPPEYQAIE